MEALIQKSNELNVPLLTMVRAFFALFTLDAQMTLAIDDVLVSEYQDTTTIIDTQLEKHVQKFRDVALNLGYRGIAATHSRGLSGGVAVSLFSAPNGVLITETIASRVTADYRFDNVPAPCPNCFVKAKSVSGNVCGTISTPVISGDLKVADSTLLESYDVPPPSATITIYHGPTTGNTYSAYDFVSNSYTIALLCFFSATDKKGACQGGAVMTFFSTQKTKFSEVVFWTSGLVTRTAGSNQMRMCVSHDCRSGPVVFSSITDFPAPPHSSFELNDINVIRISYSFPPGSELPIGKPIENVWFVPTTNVATPFTVYNNTEMNIPLWAVLVH